MLRSGRQRRRPSRGAAEAKRAGAKAAVDEAVHDALVEEAGELAAQADWLDETIG